MTRIKQVSQEAYNIGKAEGFNEFECTHGYGRFEGYYPTIYGDIYGVHIEQIDAMGCWERDIDAAAHAERRCKHKIIHDIVGLDPVFIDSAENRARIMAQIERLKK